MLSKKRRSVRKATVLARYELLKKRKEKKLRSQIKELKSKIVQNEIIRDLLSKTSDLFKEGQIDPVLVKDPAINERIKYSKRKLQKLVLDKGAQQARQETALKRKQRQLEVLKKKK